MGTNTRRDFLAAGTSAIQICPFVFKILTNQFALPFHHPHSPSPSTTRHPVAPQSLPVLPPKLAPASSPRGTTWSQAGLILFAPSNTDHPDPKIPQRSSGEIVYPALSLASKKPPRSTQNQRTPAGPNPRVHDCGSEAEISLSIPPPRSHSADSL